jgi:hypothetical protein
MKYTPAKVESTGHVVMTGPITGSVTLEDGTTYDVTQPFVEVDPDHAEEVAHLIGQRYADEGHPTDPNYTYDAPKKFSAKKKG